MERRSVLQDWVAGLSFMQQSVLISSIRGADGLHKDHISKYILRWLRRCVLISAFDGRALMSPTEPGGGSFTGPLKAEVIRDGDFMCYETDGQVLDRVMKEYLRSTDEIPHHFHMHVLHAAQIIGYKHPTPWIQGWWNKFYNHMVSDAHLFPESEQLMDRRLGDVEAQWKERELVPAADVPKTFPTLRDQASPASLPIIKDGYSYKYAIGTKFRINHPNGSYGEITGHHVGGYHGRYYFGKDMRGQYISDPFGLYDESKIVPVTEEEFLKVKEGRAFGKAGE